MRIREYCDADLAALRRMHASQGFAYPFPDLGDPIFVSKLVLEDDAGRPAMASLARLTCEMYLLVDRETNRDANCDTDREGRDDNAAPTLRAVARVARCRRARFNRARPGRRARMVAAANRQTIRAPPDGAGLDARRRLRPLLQPLRFEVNQSGHKILTDDYMSRGAEHSPPHLTDQQLGQ